jgi:hypothetical protein
MKRDKEGGEGPPWSCIYVWRVVSVWKKSSIRSPGQKRNETEKGAVGRQPPQEGFIYPY